MLRVMSAVETGMLLGRIPYAKFGTCPDPIVVVSGGQAFVQRPSPERVARDAARLARILPAGRSFILVGYDPSPADHSLATISRDLCTILAQRGSPATVIGVSYGGIVALRAAIDRPELIHRLVLLASAHAFSADGRRHVAHQIDCASRGDLVGLTEGFVAMFRRPWFNWLVRLRLRTSRGRLARTMNDPALIVRGLRAVLDAPIDPAELANVTARCLVVGGTRDQFFGDGMQQTTAAKLAHATIDLVDGETHMLPVERASHVKRALGAFFAQ